MGLLLGRHGPAAPQHPVRSFTGRRGNTEWNSTGTCCWSTTRRTSTSPLDWQEGYINAFIEAIHAAEWSDPDAAKEEVVGRMTEYLPRGELQFLMELSVEPVAAKLGLIPS